MLRIKFSRRYPIYILRMRMREEFEREIIPGISQRTSTLGNWMATYLAPGNTTYRLYMY